MGKKVYVSLSHPFSVEAPRWPYFGKAQVTSEHTMAKSGVLTQWINVPQHTGTHCDAPRHVMEYEFDGRRARYTHEMALDAYTGDAVCLPIEIEPWGLIKPEHLEAACAKIGVDPSELEGKIVVLCSGMHKLYDDTKAYYHYSVGTGFDAGMWFVEHKVKCVAMDMQALDHPLHTAMGDNGGTALHLIGWSGQKLVDEYKQLFGEEAYAEFDRNEYIRIHGKEAYDKKFEPLEKYQIWGTWEPCHKLMLGNGIVGIENLGGDLEKVKGKKFKLYCFPLRWYMGDGAMAHVIAEIDEDDLNDVPDREYFYDGTGYADAAHGGGSAQEYMMRLFNRNK